MDSGTDLLSKLAHEFVLRLRNGEQLTVERFAAEHLELAVEIQDLFPALLLVEGFDPTETKCRSGDPPQVEDMPCPSQLGDSRA